jgi:plasmid stabilization system protein ParE
VAYLRTEWTERIAENFVRDVERRLDSLSVMPYLGVKSATDPSVRKLLITRQISLLYSVQDPVVFLLSFVDNRSDPRTNRA